MIIDFFQPFYNFQLFEKRPIWSKVAVLHKTGLSQEHAKIVLPAVAYFCNTGPWRMAWIKFGYNPQKDSNSRIYQTLDYRIRTAGNYTILFFFISCLHLYH